MLPKRKAFLPSHNIEFSNPGDTRWFYRARAINVIYNNCEKLLETFNDVTEQPAGWEDESSGKFSGLLNYLDSFLFCFLVCVFYKILEQSSILYSILQRREPDFSYGTSRIERFKNFVSSLRTDECFSNSYQEAVDTVGEPLKQD